MAEKSFITGVVCLDKNFWRLAGYNFLLRKFHLCFLRNWLWRSVSGGWGVALMAIGAYRLIYRFAQTVYATDRPVFRKCVPGVEGQIVAEQVLLAAIEVLRLYGNTRNALEGRYLFTPFDSRIFDGHVVLRVLLLHLKFKTRRRTVQ
jgi:hypothetical protein